METSGLMSWSVVLAQAPAATGPGGGTGAPAASAPAGAPPASAPGVTAPGTAPVGGAGAPARAPGFDPMMIVLLFMIVLFVFMGLSGRKQRKQREAILASVKRNDRVTTTSGIVGTVVELYDNEIVLRVDEASNTRIRFRRAAIESVQREGGTGGQGASGQVESKPKAEMAKV